MRDTLEPAANDPVFGPVNGSIFELKLKELPQVGGGQQNTDTWIIQD
jgi:hypothetical protein